MSLIQKLSAVVFYQNEMCKNKTFKCKRCLCDDLRFLNHPSSILTYRHFLEITSRRQNTSCLQIQPTWTVPCASEDFSTALLFPWSVLKNLQTMIIIIDSKVTVCTNSVVSNHQDSVVGPFAGAVVLNNSSKVVLPAHRIHDHSQGTMFHQVTHHGLFLTAGGGQRDRLVLMQQNWPCEEANLLSYYHVKCTIKKEGCKIYAGYRENSTIQWDSSGTLLFTSHILSVN